MSCSGRARPPPKRDRQTGFSPSKVHIEGEHRSFHSSAFLECIERVPSQWAAFKPPRTAGWLARSLLAAAASRG